MSRKSCFQFLLLVIIVLCFGARTAHACSCSSPPPVLEAFEEAGYVVIIKVISVEKTEKAAPEGRISDGENYVAGVKSTRMLVERVFKGNLKVGEELTFAQGGGGDCVWTFSEEMIGDQFLFYLHAPRKNPALWFGPGCGRSGSLKDVDADLLYLNKLESVRGKTRLSGTLRTFGQDEELGVEGRRIRVSGAGKTYELKTSKHGAYEIYDLPAGQYTVEPEIPQGWKFNNFSRSRGETAPVKLPVTIEAKKHSELDLFFAIDNAVRGKIYDPDGRPMKDVCLDLIHAQGETPRHFYKFDCTAADGSFEIDEIPSGSYLLVVNKRGEISSHQPFKTFYHPNVYERERATVITIGKGETLEGLDIRAPDAEETVTVEGVFLYSDGKPVVQESVAFKAAKTKSNFEGDARAMTDASGRFSIIILKGLEGELYGEMYAYSSKFENCPKLDAIIKKVPGGFTDVKTPALKLRAASDLSDVELKYPFPGCKKAKRKE